MIFAWVMDRFESFAGKSLDSWMKLIQFLGKPPESWAELIQNFGKVSCVDSHKAELCPRCSHAEKVVWCKTRNFKYHLNTWSDLNEVWLPIWLENWDTCVRDQKWHPALKIKCNNLHLFLCLYAWFMGRRAPTIQFIKDKWHEQIEGIMSHLALKNNEVYLMVWTRLRSVKSVSMNEEFNVFQAVISTNTANWSIPCVHSLP